MAGAQAPDSSIRGGERGQFRPRSQPVLRETGELTGFPNHIATDGSGRFILPSGKS